MPEADRLLGSYGVTDAGAALTLHDMLRVLFRRRRIVATAVLLTTGLTTAGAYIMKPTYNAQAQVYVQRERSPTLELAGESPARAVLTREDVINSEVNLILSRGVVAAAVDTMRLWERPREDTTFSRVKRAVKETFITLGLWIRVEPREGSIIKVQKRLEAEAEPDSDIISIWHVGDKPALSAEIVNAVVDAYLRARQESHVKSGRHAFFQEQAQRAEAEQTSLEQEREALKAEWHIVEIAQEKSLAIDALALTESRLQETIGDIRKLEQTKKRLTDDVADLPERVTTATETERSELYDEMVTMLARLEADEAEKLVRWPADDPRVLEVSRARASVEARLANLTAVVPSSTREELNPLRMALLEQQKLMAADLAGLRAKFETYEAQHGQLKADLLTLDTRESRLRKLDEALALVRGKRGTFLERAEEARIQAESGPGFANAWVIHRADVPQRPTLMRIIALALGAVLGVVLAGLLVAAAEFFDHSIHSREDVARHLGVPVLAVLPNQRG